MPNDFDEEEEGCKSTSKRPRRTAAVRAQAVLVAASSGESSPAASGSTTSRRRPSNSSHSSNHPSPAASFHSNSPPAYPNSAPVFAHSPLNENHPASPAAAHSKAALAPPPPTSHLHSSSRPHSTSCGFCSTSSDCLCAEIGYEYASSSTTPSNTLQSSSSVKMETAPSPRPPPEDLLFASEVNYEPAVPLRLSTVNRSKVQSVWRIDPPQPIKSKFDTVVAVAEKALCSGDPSNCPACSDDP